MHYNKNGREKIVSQKFSLNVELLNAIDCIARFYNTTPSVVVENALKCKLKCKDGGNYEKAWKVSNRKLTKKNKKVFVSQRDYKGHKKASQERESLTMSLPYFNGGKFYSV